MVTLPTVLKIKAGMPAADMIRWAATSRVVVPVVMPSRDTVAISFSVLIALPIQLLSVAGKELCSQLDEILLDLLRVVEIVAGDKSII
jgi:hypothetical protein